MYDSRVAGQFASEVTHNSLSETGEGYLRGKLQGETGETAANPSDQFEMEKNMKGLLKPILRLLGIPIYLLTICRIGSCPAPAFAETFADSDKPDTFKIQDFSITTPWGYNKADNSKRKYPLVVNGCWGEGPHFSEDIRKKYPSFYLDFNNHSKEADGALLADLIDELIRQNHRVDTNRIYLTGFSAGGSGSFKIVRGMLSKNKLFAGIIRVAGQSESVLAEPAVEKTSIWYHIGLTDEPVRIEVARDTYKNLKSHPVNAMAIESTKTDDITGYNRTTKTLTRNGVEAFKMSEYTGLGHEPAPCYKDPGLFDWLFSQTLAQ